MSSFAKEISAVNTAPYFWTAAAGVAVAYWAAATRKSRMRDTSTQNKCILITGCDSGFGHLLVHACLKAGYTVIAACFQEKGVVDLKRTLKEYDDSLSRLTTVVADLSSSQGCQTVVQVTKEICVNGLYALVNNAGVCLPGDIYWVLPQRYDDCMKVNFLAAVELTYELLPLLKRQEGRVINVTSVDGIVALPGNAPYVASKMALEAYSDCLRCEMLPWRVKVIVIEPSTMKTPLAMAFANGLKKTFAEAPADRQNYYGQAYIDHLYTSACKVLEDAAMDPQETVNHLMDALQLVHPPTRILSGLAAKVLFKPLSFLPDELRDATISWFLKLKVIPMRLKVPVPPTNHIAYVTRVVSNLTQSVAYYKKLSYECVNEPLDGQQFMRYCGDSSDASAKWQALLLLKEESNVVSLSEKGPWSIQLNRLIHFTTNLDADIRRLEDAGLHPAVPLARNGMTRVANYSDPDNYLCCFIQLGGLKRLVMKAAHLWYKTPCSTLLPCAIQESDTQTIKRIFEELGFITLHDYNKRDLTSNLLAIFGTNEIPHTVIDQVRLASLPNDTFTIALIEWNRSVFEQSNPEQRHSTFAIAVTDAEHCLKLAKNAGMMVNDTVVTKVLPYYGKVQLASAFLDENRSNGIEFVQF